MSCEGKGSSKNKIINNLRKKEKKKEEDGHGHVNCLHALSYLCFVPKPWAHVGHVSLYLFPSLFLAAFHLSPSSNLPPLNSYPPFLFSSVSKPLIIINCKPFNNNYTFSLTITTFLLYYLVPKKENKRIKSWECDYVFFTTLCIHHVQSNKKNGSWVFSETS